MPTAVFRHEGNTIDYTPSVAIAAGDPVLQADLFGIAAVDIAANELGALAIEGVFDIAKSTAASTAFVAGALAYWNAGASQVTITATSNKLIGKAVVGGTDADATARIKLTP